MLDPTPGSATSYPSGATPAPAAPTAPASSSEWPATTGSARLQPPLRGVDTEHWTPGDPGEAQAAIEAVAAYCRDYCPARLSCVEERCRLYRLEQRALGALGYRTNAATEAVGVESQPIIGLGI